MSLSPAEAQLLATVVVGLFLFAMFGFYRWTKGRSPNTQVWGTIFESLTHYVQPQEHLKEPKQEIRQEKKESGDDEHKNDRRSSES